mmetsp:Transcript_413/g.914  ORF Transcript_413/g.914 Transcript_413/m.914 type:complete len:801 (-) Transcript_413:296-2698(-)
MNLKLNLPPMPQPPPELANEETSGDIIAVPWSPPSGDIAVAQGAEDYEMVVDADDDDDDDGGGVYNENEYEEDEIIASPYDVDEEEEEEELDEKANNKAGENYDIPSASSGPLLSSTTVMTHNNNADNPKAIDTTITMEVEDSVLGEDSVAEGEGTTTMTTPKKTGKFSPFAFDESKMNSMMKDAMAGTTAMAQPPLVSVEEIPRPPSLPMEEVPLSSPVASLMLTSPLMGEEEEEEVAVVQNKVEQVQEQEEELSGDPEDLPGQLESWPEQLDSEEEAIPQEAKAMLLLSEEDEEEEEGDGSAEGNIISQDENVDERGEDANNEGGEEQDDNDNADEEEEEDEGDNGAVAKVKEGTASLGEEVVEEENDSKLTSKEEDRSITTKSEAQRIDELHAILPDSSMEEIRAIVREENDNASASTNSRQSAADATMEMAAASTAKEEVDRSNNTTAKSEFNNDGEEETTSCNAAKWHFNPKLGKCSNSFEDKAIFIYDTLGECCLKFFMKEECGERVEDICSKSNGDDVDDSEEGEDDHGNIEEGGVTADEEEEEPEDIKKEDKEEMKIDDEDEDLEQEDDEDTVEEVNTNQEDATEEDKPAPSTDSLDDSQDNDPSSTTEGQGAELTNKNTNQNWEGFDEDFSSKVVNEKEEETNQHIIETHDVSELNNNVQGYEGDGFRFHILHPKNGKGGSFLQTSTLGVGAALLAAFLLCFCYCKYHRRGRYNRHRHSRMPQRGTYAALGSDDFFNGTFSDDISFRGKDSDDEMSMNSYESEEDGVVKLEMGGIHEMDANGGLTLDECNG